MPVPLLPATSWADPALAALLERQGRTLGASAWARAFVTLEPTTALWVEAMHAPAVRQSRSLRSACFAWVGSGVASALLAPTVEQWWEDLAPALLAQWWNALLAEAACDAISAMILVEVVLAVPAPQLAALTDRAWVLACHHPDETVAHAARLRCLAPVPGLATDGREAPR